MRRLSVSDEVVQVYSVYLNSTSHHLIHNPVSHIFYSLKIGTPVYIAPEVARAERYSESADVFSFALVLLELVTGVSTEDRFKEMGIECKGISAHHQAGKRAGLEAVKRTAENEDALKLVQRCWAKDPSSRPSMQECIDALTLGFGSSHKEQEDGEGVGNVAVVESKGDDVGDEKLKAELAEMKVEVARKDEELRKKEEESRKKDSAFAGKVEELRKKDGALADKVQDLKNKDVQLKRAMSAKDAELQRALLEIADKEKVITELRRRLPRAAEEEVSEYAGRAGGD